jgi:hypothetical protein
MFVIMQEQMKKNNKELVENKVNEVRPIVEKDKINEPRIIENTRDKVVVDEDVSKLYNNMRGILEGKSNTIDNKPNYNGNNKSNYNGNDKGSVL